MSILLCAYAGRQRGEEEERTVGGTGELVIGWFVDRSVGE